jgi:hypothetical protein
MNIGTPLTHKRRNPFFDDIKQNSKSAGLQVNIFAGPLLILIHTKFELADIMIALWEVGSV